MSSKDTHQPERIMNSGSTEQAGRNHGQANHNQRGHHRRTSEPLETIQGLSIDPTSSSRETTEDSVTSSGSASASHVVDRRQLFDRHWSTSNLTSQNTAVRGYGRPTAARHRNSTEGTQVASSASNFLTSVADIQQFHMSWANTAGSDIFGATTAVAAPSLNSSMASLGETTAAVFALGPMESPPVPRRASVSPRVDSSSLIHDAARITDWDKVLELCNTNPDYAKYTGGDGWTALHHACNRRCPRPEVVEALIEAYPNALSTEEEKGWLPLHYACRFKAPKEVVNLLLHSYPDKGEASVAQKDRQGRPPLYYAIRYDAPPGVVGLLLAVNPATVLEADQNDESPLALVWDNWAEKLEARRIIHSFMPGGFPEQEGMTEQQRAKMLRQRLTRQSKLLKRWRQVNVLLKAAFGFPVEEASWDAMDLNETSTDSMDRKWRIVHAAASIKCHVSLFLLACALHPEQARELDENELRFSKDVMLSGQSTHQTALHFAAASSVGGEAGKTVVHHLLGLYRESAHIQDAIDGSLPFHLMVENRHKLDWPNHAAILYHVYPRAVRVPDHQGRLPLHRATAAIAHQDRDEEYFETSVIINIVRNYPQAASHADNSGCLPFHHVAKNATIWDDEVEAVYNAHRGAAQARTGPTLGSRLPLHLAASRKETQAGLISRLLQIHPRAASVADRNGKLPFHLACEAGKDWSEGLSSLQEAFPEGVRQAEGNDRGWLPLHMVAAAVGSNGDLLSKLAELHPEGVTTPDSKGSYPLHLALQNGKLWSSGVRTLFEAGPAVISYPDASSNLLPFQIVALKYCGSSEANNMTSREVDELGCMFELLRCDPNVIS